MRPVSRAITINHTATSISDPAVAAVRCSMGLLLVSARMRPADGICRSATI
jgi:hypothetical protein